MAHSKFASIFPTPHTPHPIPCLVFSLVVTPSGGDGEMGRWGDGGDFY
ncbi:MAG: hypothetical protein F6J90_07060 [Moorea sp. SIOASIH]|nr:hypothetical protein [Moorena sp. SIOASIH]NEO36097.1 hypothetical protein [Moorena sp. SIOASIH]